MSFKKIKFGQSSAEREPKEVFDAVFLDEGYIDKICEDNKFLILGQKGTGKSAIGVKLDLISQTKDDFYVKRYSLKDFSYEPLLTPSSERPMNRLKLQQDWEYILLVAFLNSLLHDAEALNQNQNLEELIELIQSYGLLPSENLNQIVQKTTTKSAGIQAYAFSGSTTSRKETHPFDLSMLFNTLKENCYSVILESKHYIIVDGLDESFEYGRQDELYALLSALLLAADSMNTTFIDNGINAKIILLSRIDLFSKLPGSNNNKIKQDCSISLNWYQEKNPNSSNLVKLINKRAEISLGRDVNVFDEFLPSTITKYNKSTLKYLLTYTRHTPRDIIELMNYIQEATIGEVATEDEIWSGINSYSNQYFITEVFDELYGFLSRPEIEDTLSLLKSMKKTKFTVNEIKQKSVLAQGFILSSIEERLSLLFECHAIGNEDHGRFSFKARNIHSTFDNEDVILVHRGLHKALNLTGNKQ